MIKHVPDGFVSGISFDEFIDMYKRLFLLCRTVVSGEVSDILPQKSSQKVIVNLSIEYAI